jgi:polyhydroxyalkanoate synthesis regulator phasin
MTGRRKVAIGAGAGAAVLVAAMLGAAGAIAASKALSSDEPSKAIIDDAAGQLGIEPSELADALQQALENRIDEAVDEGRLSEEQAERLKERLDAKEYPTLFGLGAVPRAYGFGFGGFGHRPSFAGGFGIAEAAASFLGMTQAELRTELRDKTLAEIATERGKTAPGLVDALVAARTARIDEAVDDGKLTEEQAARLKDGLEDRMEALVSGELRQRWAGKHRFWHGAWSPRGPPPSGRPSG